MVLLSKMNQVVSDPIYGPTCCAKGIRGYGNPNADVMLIGIAPGQEEMRKGRPLVGVTGEFFDAVLKAYHINRDALYCTNLVCTQHDKPTAQEIAQCSMRLMSEITTIKPKLIITMGEIPCATLLGYKLSKARGGVYHWKSPTSQWHTWMMPTYHPAAVLRGQVNLIYDIVRDLKKIGDILEWPTDGSHERVDWSICATQEDAQAALDSFDHGELVTIDIETDSKKDVNEPFTSNLVCIGISNGDRTYVIPARFCAQLEWPSDLRYGYHYAIFDQPELRRMLNINLPIDEDSLMGSYSLDERGGAEYQVSIHGLKPNLREYCGFGFYDADIDRKHLEKYPFAQVAEYNAKDVAGTNRLIKHQKPRMEQDGVYGLYHDILMPGLNAFADIYHYGVAVDRPTIKSLYEEWGPRYIMEERVLQQRAEQMGFPGQINLNSPQQLAKFLYDILGHPTRSSGDRSVDKDHLQDIDDPYVADLQQHRMLGKMLQVYLLGIEDDIKYDNLLHPIPFLHGTSSGRLSYHDPPIQTLPKDYRVGELAKFRRMFVPHDVDTHFFLEADYSQLEIWIAAALSGDDVMLADLNSGDFHGRVAMQVFNITPDTVSKEFWGNRRTQAKKVTFLIFYGGEASTLANRQTGIGCTREEAQAVIDSYRSKYLKYGAWCEDIKEQALNNGYLTTCFGRKRRFPLIMDQGPLRQAINFPIQSIASDCCLTSLIELHHLLKRYNSRVIWTVHDSILFEIARECKDEAIELIHKVMTRPRHPSLPALKVEMTMGNNLFDMEKVAA